MFSQTKQRSGDDAMPIEAPSLPDSTTKIMETMAAVVPPPRVEGVTASGIRYMPGYVPPVQPVVKSLVVGSGDRPLLYDKERKMYFHKREEVAAARGEKITLQFKLTGQSLDALLTLLRAEGQVTHVKPSRAAEHAYYVQTNLTQLSEVEAFIEYLNKKYPLQQCYHPKSAEGLLCPGFS